MVKWAVSICVSVLLGWGVGGKSGGEKAPGEDSGVPVTLSSLKPADEAGLYFHPLQAGGGSGMGEARHTEQWLGVCQPLSPANNPPTRQHGPPGVPAVFEGTHTGAPEGAKPTAGCPSASGSDVWRESQGEEQTAIPPPPEAPLPGIPPPPPRSMPWPLLVGGGQEESWLGMGVWGKPGRERGCEEPLHTFRGGSKSPLRCVLRARRGQWRAGSGQARSCWSFCSSEWGCSIPLGMRDHSGPLQNRSCWGPGELTSSALERVP